MDSLKPSYLQRADENLPALLTREIRPATPLQTLKMGDTVTLDLGNHYVGYFAFTMGWVNVYVDAPVRLRVRFAEAERELSYDYTPHYDRVTGAWLQEDVIHVDFPGEYKMPACWNTNSSRKLKNRPLTNVLKSEPATGVNAYALTISRRTV